MKLHLFTFLIIIALNTICPNSLKGSHSITLNVYTINHDMMIQSSDNELISLSDIYKRIHPDLSIQSPGRRLPLAWTFVTSLQWRKLELTFSVLLIMIQRLRKEKILCVRVIRFDNESWLYDRKYRSLHPIISFENNPKWVMTKLNEYFVQL